MFNRLEVSARREIVVFWYFILSLLCSHSLYFGHLHASVCFVLHKIQFGL